MRKRAVPDAPQGDLASFTMVSMDTKILTSLQNVMAHLCVVRFEDGTPRKPGRMFIETQGTMWKIVLKEPEGGLELAVCANTIDDALATADLLLGSDQCPWQLDPWQHGKINGKKK